MISRSGYSGIAVTQVHEGIVVHHIDCPWRPADVEQREGRILRQGNQNSTVEMHRYVVERSFDAFMWQTVERKARFIAQVMRGSLDAREIEDVGDAAISAAETKAIATRNPLLLDQVQTNDELQKLRRLERAHNRAQSNLVRSREYAQQRAQVLTRNLASLEQAAGRVVATSGDDFAMRISSDGGYGARWERHEKRVDAAHAIGQWSQQSRLASRAFSVRLGAVAEIGEFTVMAELVTAQGMSDATVKFTIDGVPDAEASTSRRDVLAGSAGVVTRLENLQASIPTLVERTRERIADNDLNLVDAEQRIGQPFKHAEQLAAVQTRANEIAAQLAAEETKADPAVAAQSPAAAFLEEIKSDAWWDGRSTADVRQVLDTQRAARAGSSEAGLVYDGLSAEIRRRYPETVARRFGIEEARERPAATDPSATGAVAPQR